QHDAVAPPTGQRLAHDLLGLAGRVHVGRVDEVHARVEGGMDDASAFLVIGVPPGPEHHRPQAEGAHLHAGAAERAILHVFLTGWGPNPSLRPEWDPQPTGAVEAAAYCRP